MEPDSIARTLAESGCREKSKKTDSVSEIRVPEGIIRGGGAETKLSGLPVARLTDLAQDTCRRKSIASVAVRPK